MKEYNKQVGDFEITRTWNNVFNIYRVVSVSDNGTVSTYTGKYAFSFEDAKKLMKQMKAEEQGKNALRSIMALAWQFVKKNGYTLSEALKCAWRNYRLKQAMTTKIVRFYFRKVDGTIREAFGTLIPSMLPETKGTGRKTSDTLQTYFDTEKQEYRSFKKANLITI